MKEFEASVKNAENNIKQIEKIEDIFMKCEAAPIEQAQKIFSHIPEVRGNN